MGPHFLLSRVDFGSIGGGARHALGGTFDREFVDHGVSGGVMAGDRPASRNCSPTFARVILSGVYSIDRLGRDALDVQSVIRRLLEKGVTVDVRGLGPIGRGVGELIVAVLAQIADMERVRIKERCDAGRDVAKASLLATGKTHKGKSRPRTPCRWRQGSGSCVAEC